MLVVRGTKKLRDRVRGTPAKPDDVSTTMLGDWFATALFWKPQVALLVNERTLLPVFMPLAPASTMLPRIPFVVSRVLRRHGVDEATIDSEVVAMVNPTIAPTDNRSVVGVMNEFARHGGAVLRATGVDLEELSMQMSKMIVGPLMKGNRSPDRELAAVLGIRPAERLPSNVIPFPGSRRSQPTVASVVQPHASGSIYQLKVTLKHVKPPVWRRVLVDGGSTLDEIHEVIQAAFGWWNYHLHEFEVGDTKYGVPDDDDWGLPTLDERRVRLDSIAGAGSSFTYTYDFGDSWDHQVTVEKILPATPDTAVPACIDGRRACPPEDCGGPWGYRELLAILADRFHPEHRQRAEWLGRPLDPEAFDPGEFTHNLREVRLAAFDE